MNKFSLLLALALLASVPAFAGHKGFISFTEEERARHEATQDQLLSTAASCLEADLSYHLSFYRKHGISPFYGDRSSFGKLRHGSKRNYLRRIGRNPNLLNQMRPTSCVGLALKCMGKGFEAAGQADLWQRIRAFTLLNEADGTAMQAALQQLGWKILYWNPDVRLSDDWDRQERRRNSRNTDRFWGYHQYNWMLASRHNKYLYNKVDDVRLLVNFGRQVPPAIKAVPFWLGIAHGGYHVFPGMGGRIVEAHSMRLLNDVRTLEAEPFNPLAGKAPTQGTYKSGLIAVPAKYVR
jgi:hypothetical protein